MKPLFGTETPSTSVPFPVAESNSFNVPAVAATSVSAASSRASLQALTILKEEDIAQLGEQATSGLSQVPSKLMGSLRAADAGDFGTELNQLVVVAKGLDPKTMENRGFLSKAFSFLSSTKERLLSQYNTVEKQMDALVVELEKKATHHKSRIADLDQLYDDNVIYYRGLEDAVKRGEDMSNQLSTALASYPAPTDPFEAQQLSEVKRGLDRLEKRIDDLKRAMLLSMQAAPQIRLTQDNARALVQKFSDVKTLTLPAWKNNFSLYIIQLEQKQAVGVLTAVDDATDAALRQGADLLRQNTEAITRARGRSIVSIETLVHVQSQLIGAVDDMQRIADEDRAARKAAAPKLLELERELVAKFTPGQR